MVTKNEKSNALLIHLSSFSGFIIPFGSIILPLILWQSFKNESEFVNKHGKEAMNFNLSFLLYNIVLIIITVPMFIASIIPMLEGVKNIDDQSFSFLGISGLIAIPLAYIALFLVQFITTIIAAVKANNGESYNYPMTIRFIK